MIQANIREKKFVPLSHHWKRNRTRRKKNDKKDKFLILSSAEIFMIFFLFCLLLKSHWFVALVVCANSQIYTMKRGKKHFFEHRLQINILFLSKIIFLHFPLHWYRQQARYKCAFDIKCSSYARVSVCSTSNC